MVYSPLEVRLGVVKVRGFFGCWNLPNLRNHTIVNLYIWRSEKVISFKLPVFCVGVVQILFLVQGGGGPLVDSRHQRCGEGYTACFSGADRFIVIHGGYCLIVIIKFHQLLEDLCRGSLGGKIKQGPPGGGVQRVAVARQLARIIISSTAIGLLHCGGPCREEDGKTELLGDFFHDRCCS